MLSLCAQVPRACAEAFVARLRAAGAYTDPTRLRLNVLPSGGWCGHIFRDQAEVTRQTLAFSSPRPLESSTGYPGRSLRVFVKILWKNGRKWFIIYTPAKSVAKHLTYVCQNLCSHTSVAELGFFESPLPCALRM